MRISCYPGGDAGGVAVTDQQATIAELRTWVRDFVAERDWEKFHTPKNLSMSIAIEAAELMEHFQWPDTGDFSTVHDDPQSMELIREEIADVLCYVLAFANALEIDLASALRDKMIKNAVKYPADRFRGRFR